jgi:antitoxin (DNA-binding transcriptional repressor) of toxin-antitoxin stability system
VRINALKLRQSLGKILDGLKDSDEPIIVEKGREPIAVLIPFRVFRERFVDYREEQKRLEILEAFRTAAVPPTEDTLEALRRLRYGPDN